MKFIPGVSITLLLMSHGAYPQNRIGTGEVEELYQTMCAACHGRDFEGGVGGNLIDGVWNHGSSDEEIANNIRNGNIELGMVPYKDVLSDEQIRSLVIFLMEKTYQTKTEDVAERADPEEGVYESDHHQFRLEKVAEHKDIFWSVDFMPDGRILAAQLKGTLRVIEDGKLSKPIKGTPEVWYRGQGGLMEVQLHPDYEENGWIYLGFSENTGAKENNRTAGMTAIVRGRIKDGRWVDQEEIYQVPPELHISTGAHFGTRFVFKDGYLFFSIGDRGRMQLAQDITRPNGKIHRIWDDGRIPVDNPFYNEPNAIKSVWSYGHRNPQGLDMHPLTGDIWSTEHGPRGGDELNKVEKGLNYGWPEITYGMNYNGKPITDKTAAPGMEQPEYYWLPSIAVCGIDFYTGNHFPQWKNDLFITGLSAQELQRFRIENGKVVEQEIVLKNQGRVRDVHNGPDGHLYIILNKSRQNDTGRLYRMVRMDGALSDTR